MPWPLVWLVDCQSARVPMSFASQSRDSGAVWRCATIPEKLSVRLGSSPGDSGERFGVGDRLGDDDDLPAVAAAALQDRDGAIGGHLDHGAELVEHQRPRHAGLACGVVQVGEREHGHRGGLVGHHVGVHAPHHDRPGAERVDESDADRFSVGRDPGRDDLAVGERERDLQPRRAAGEILVAFARGRRSSPCSCDAAGQLAVLSPRPSAIALSAS